MFEGSEHHDSGFFQPLQAAGASLNGSTNADRTNYWEVVPSGALELALWMESDRMGYLLPALTAAEVREPARRRAERAPAELREPALRPGVDGHAGGAVPAGPSVPLDDHRRGRRPAGREAGRGPRSSSDATIIRRTRRSRSRATSIPRRRWRSCARTSSRSTPGALVEPVRAGARRSTASGAFCWRIASSCRGSTSRG